MLILIDFHVTFFIYLYFVIVPKSIIQQNGITIVQFYTIQLEY